MYGISKVMRLPLRVNSDLMPMAVLYILAHPTRANGKPQGV